MMNLFARETILMTILMIFCVRGIVTAAAPSCLRHAPSLPALLVKSCFSTFTGDGRLASMRETDMAYTFGPLAESDSPRGSKYLNNEYLAQTILISSYIEFQSSHYVHTGILDFYIGDC